MALTIEDRIVRQLACGSCGRSYELVTGFILQDGDAQAVYFAACHRHEGESEVWSDVALGSWDEASTDLATFSCRVSAGGASLVQPFVAAEGRADFFGRKLDRDASSADDRLDSFWAVVDQVLLSDETVGAHLRASA